MHRRAPLLLLTLVASGAIAANASGDRSPGTELAPAGACPPAPIATIDLPERMQARQDTPRAPIAIPRNGRFRVRSYVGPLETVSIRVLENGEPIGFERRVDGAEADLVPARALSVGARVVVEVGGIATGTYRVEAREDTTRPVIDGVVVESVAPRFESRVVCPPPGPVADWVRGTVAARDDSTLHLVARLLVGGKDVRATEVATHRDARRGLFTVALRFPAGSLPRGERVTLRVEAVDSGGNVSAPVDVAVDVPPDPHVADAGASPPPGPTKRGCS